MKSNKAGLYPLLFEPIYQYRPWGGRALESILRAPLPDGLVGEAWVLSDRPEQQSKVANGPLAGLTLRHLLEQFSEQMMGCKTDPSARFPLLLKFLDARDVLSVQVHPSDRQPEYLPAGETGKSEAWVVLKTEPGSLIYAGLRSGATKESVVQAVSDGTVAGQLASFTPEVGDTVFVAAGTVHALGGGTVVFEPQQNSDVTFRLFDWDHIDTKTGQPRQLQVPQAIACVDFGRGAVLPVTPVVQTTTPVRRENLVDCDSFHMSRVRADSEFSVGMDGQPVIIVCIDGTGAVDYGGQNHEVASGDVMLLPAVVGECKFCPGGPVTILNLALPR